MSFSGRATAIRKRSSPKSQIIFAFVFSCIGDLFVFLGLIFFKLRQVCVFLSLTAHGYVQPLTMEHCGSVHYITIGDSRLLTAAGLTRSPVYLIGDAASRCGLSRVGYFIPLNGRRPLNGHPPSYDYHSIWQQQAFPLMNCLPASVLIVALFLEAIVRSSDSDRWPQSSP